MADQQERTEEPSPRKREEAREEGQVARSPEVSIALGLLAAVFAFRLTAEGMVATLGRVMHFYFHMMGQWTREDFTFERVRDMGRNGFSFMLTILGPLFLALLVTGILANVMQVGPYFSLKPLQPRLSRISLRKGLGAIFSKRSLVEATKSLAKVALLSTFAYRLIVRELPMILNLPLAEPERVLRVMGWLVYRLALLMGVFFLILAIIDFAYQRWQYYQNLKMSREEVKEETKQYEGDPQVKARIRMIQRDVARRRMMKEVPTASVVITNPFHIAVALKYERDTMTAPKVVAKGARLVADRIRQEAREANVPIVEDRPLARALFKQVPIGSEITSDFYKAVAEVLAYIYRLRRPSSASMQERGAQAAPTVTVPTSTATMAGPSG